MSADAAILCAVKGRVQGVGFRASTVCRARALGLVGWCRNEPDGSVTVVAQGAEADVERLSGWLQRGPTGAQVASATHQDIPVDLRLTEFAIR